MIASAHRVPPGCLVPWHGAAREGSSLQRVSELPRVLLQLLGLGPEVAQGRGARVLEHGVLGGQGQVLEQPAEAVAAAEDLVAQVPVLCLLAQRVHQLLSHHDDQLAVRDEDLGGLAVVEAAAKDADGFEERPEIQPAVFRQVDFLLGVLLTRRPAGRRAGVLGKEKNTTDEGRVPSAGRACLDLPCLWLLHHQLELDPPAPEKGLEWTGCIPHGGGTACNPSLKSPISISRDMSESRFSLPLNSVATEDTACIYCVRQ